MSKAYHPSQYISFLFWEWFKWVSNLELNVKMFQSWWIFTTQFFYTFYRLYSCYHVLYIIANTVINMTTIAFDIVLISFIIIWQLLYGYQGSSKTREVGFDIKGSSVVIIFFLMQWSLNNPFSHSQIWHRDKALIWEEFGTFCQGTWPKHKPGFQNSSGDLQIKCF